MNKKYKVKHTSIMHNSKVYAEGSVIELSDIQAKRLEDFVELLPNQQSAARSKTQTDTQASKTKKSENATAKNQPETETKNETKEGAVTTKPETKDGEKGGSDDK